MENFGDRCQAVRCAARVGDAILVRSNLIVVDAQNASQIGTVFCRCANDNFLGTSSDVRIVTWFVASRFAAEDAGTFNHDVDLLLAPWQIGWVAFRVDADFFSVDDQILVVRTDFAVKAAVNRVVLEQHRQSVVVSKVIYGDYFELTRTRDQVAKS